MQEKCRHRPPAVAAAAVLNSAEPPLMAGTCIGYWSWLSRAKVRNAKPTCLRLFTQLMRCARALARASAGSNMAARMAIIAMTTNNSIKVKAANFLRRFFIELYWFLIWFLSEQAVILFGFTGTVNTFENLLSSVDA